MTQPTLPQRAHEHNLRILEGVNRMPAVADGLLDGGREEAGRDLRDLREFLDGTLIPHLDAAERALYPELERMFQNRHSMAPMRREHEAIRGLTTQLGTLVDRSEGHLTIGATLALRRVMFNLYALLKVHLAEEEAYLRLIEHGVPEDVADAVAAALDHPIGGG